MRLEDIDLYDPDGYVDAVPHEAFAVLRRQAPVFWQSTPWGGGYWAVMKHADVVAVSTDPTTYSSERGSVIIEDLSEETLQMMRNMLLVMDPPHHGRYRRMVLHGFTPSLVDRLEPRIRTISRAIIEQAAARREVEFVHDVASRLPLQVIGELMGIPEAEREPINEWAERMTASQDPEINPESDAGQASVAMGTYAVTMAQEKRVRPGNDLTSIIVNAEVDGHVMNDFEFGAFFVQLVTAGNDTTRTMLSNALQALLQHPEQLSELRTTPALVPAMIEEVLRWASPLHYFRRTATRDVELHGQPIREGDKVVLMYTSANRDEEVFADAARFDIHRDPNPHVAFGFGEHYCLGARLARLEGRVFFEELLSHCPTIEPRGAARRQRSNLNNGLKSLPVYLGAGSP